MSSHSEQHESRVDLLFMTIEQVEHARDIFLKAVVQDGDGKNNRMSKVIR